MPPSRTEGSSRRICEYPCLPPVLQSGLTFANPPQPTPSKPKLLPYTGACQAMKSSTQKNLLPKHARITKESLMAACSRVVALAAQYKPSEHHRELGYDGLLFGYMDACFGKMKRQHQVWIGKSKWPKRLDFRQGGVRPVVLEFAVKTPGRNEIAAKGNAPELRKLTRQHRASTRYLILFDLSGNPPVDTSILWSDYDAINGGPGKFKRRAVQILYVHPEYVEPHLWKPT